MPSGICGGCGRRTNSTTSNWWERKPEGYVPTECYVAWVDGEPVKGCAFDRCRDSYMKAFAIRILTGKEPKIRRLKGGRR